MPVQTRSETVRGGTEYLTGTFRPETLNREERTIEVVFTTGQAGRRYDWWEDEEYMEELDVTAASVRTDRLDKGLSVIGDHRTYAGIDNVFGVTESYRFETGNKLVGTVRFASDEKSEQRFVKVADGILRHVSLGYNVYTYLRTQGSDDKLPTMRATDWEPTELSFVVTPFETTNGTRSAERSQEEQHDIEIVIEQQEDRQMGDKSKQAGKPEVTDEVRTDETPVEQKPVVETAERKAEPEQKPAVETNERTVEARNAELPVMIRAAEQAGLDATVATDAFARGETADQFYKTVVETLGADSQERSVKTTLKSDQRADQRENTRMAAESYLMERSGQSGHDGVDTGDFTGMTLFDMARDFAERSNVNTRGLSRHKVVSRAFHSTSDFPLILENVMNKNLLAGYNETPQTWKGLGRKSTVNDFRAKHVYRLGDAPSLRPLNENGEYQSGSFSEAKESYAISTFARKIGITRQAIINDDMSALDRLPTFFGQSGARLESDIVWGLLLGYDFQANKAVSFTMRDGKPVFHADHKNKLTAGSALSKSALQELRKLGRKQKTMDGHFMNVSYDFIAVGEDLEQEAEEIMFPVYSPNSSSDQKLRHNMQLIVEPRLTVVSPEAWYAFSKMMDTFEYSYLAGEEQMMVEVNQHTDVDGLEVKVRKDFGAGIVDHRGMAMATGAA